MKLGVLFSGGKDSTFAAWLAKKEGHELSCLMTMVSSNEDSYMFHTPSILKTKIQAEVIRLPLIIGNTKGEKEEELKDLYSLLKKAREEIGIEGIVTGAVESVYQASRIQKVCYELKLECFNPLWQINQIELLEGLIDQGFDAVIVGVAAYPLDKSFLGRKIDKRFISDMKKLNEKFKISPAGEGGEFESFVLNCPLFKRSLKIIGFMDFGEGNSWRREIELK